MAFDLAAKLRQVSNLNTQEQIEYLPFELLDPDPENFYSLEGLNELADSIATVGLVHPLRVRQSGERYMITSGHRRRAAIQLLIDSGEDWSRGVACIVDRGEEQPEFTELKMIFANNQRVKSAAELSREAEKTEELLCKLKEKGYEFPGRMQEHVAQALNVKTGKLKRLHAIRNNLVPDLLRLFDSGILNEEAAYQLQQLPHIAQLYLSTGKKVKDYGIRGVNAKECVVFSEKYLNPNCKCPDGSKCEQVMPRFYQTAVSPLYAKCNGGCCLKCNRSPSECPCRCNRAKKQLKEQKEDRKIEQARVEKERVKLYDENRAVLAGKYGALDIFARELKLPDDEPTRIPGCQTIGDLHARARGEGINDYKARNASVFDDYTYVQSVAAAADQLGVSVDFLLGRTDVPAVNRGDSPPKKTGELLGELCGGKGEASIPPPAAAGTETDCHTSDNGHWFAMTGDGEAEETPLSAKGATSPGGGNEVEPRWQSGTPGRIGRYFCQMRGNSDDETEPPKEFRFDWDGEQWYFVGRPIMKGMIVVGWWPLPDEEKQHE